LTLSQLPADAPESVKLLAQQCTLTAYEERPSAQDTFDWLNDYYITINLDDDDDDLNPAPPMNPIPEHFGGEEDS
jgi:hypothetical protein